jgi:hypothetical protein
VGAERIVVVIGQVLGGNLGVATFLVGELNAGPFRNECRFGSGRGTGLGFTGSLGLPLQDRFPVLDFSSIKLFFPFCGRQRTLGAMVVVLVAPRATVCLDVIEQLALGIVGDLSAVDRGGSVGAFEAGREAGGLLVGGAWVAGRILAGLEFVFVFLSLPCVGGSRLLFSSGSSKLVMGVLTPLNHGDFTPLVYMTYACPVRIPKSGLLKVSASRRSIFVYNIPIERSNDSGWTLPSQNFEIRTPLPIVSRSKVCRILSVFSWWFTGIFIIGP